MASGPIHFSRKPYNVVYYKDGERHTIRRRPPPKLHDIWPEDIVSLTRNKNDDFQEGDEFEVKSINYRHPNTLKLVDDDDHTTFVHYYDLNLEEQVGPRVGGYGQNSEEGNRYLTWP